MTAQLTHSMVNRARHESDVLATLKGRRKCRRVGCGSHTRTAAGGGRSRRTSESEAAEQSGRVKEAALAQRRAELETARTTAEARLNDVAAAEQAVSEATLLEQQFEGASEAHGLASKAVVDAERALRTCDDRTTLNELIAREEAGAHATEQFADAQRQEQAARNQLRRRDRCGGGCRAPIATTARWNCSRRNSGRQIQKSCCCRPSKCTSHRDAAYRCAGSRRRG